MGAGGLFGGIGAGILTIILIYVLKAKGAELSRRRSVVFGIVGAIFLIVGLLLMIAPKFSPVLEKNAGLLLPIGMAHVFFGVTCVMFSEVYNILREVQKKGRSESSSEKTQ